jgi:hypothetical protein
MSRRVGDFCGLPCLKLVQEAHFRSLIGKDWWKSDTPFLIQEGKACTLTSLPFLCLLCACCQTRVFNDVFGRQKVGFVFVVPPFL